MPHGSVCSSMIFCRSLVEPVALGEQLVEVGAAQHRAQRGLGDLRRGGREGLDLRDRRGGVDDAEVADRRHPGRHVVARDDLLRRHRERHRAQVHAHHPVDQRHEHHEAGPLDGEQAAEAEDDRPLVLAQDAHARGDSPARTTTAQTAATVIPSLLVRFCEAQRLRSRPVCGIATQPSPWEGARSGKPAGWRAEVAQQPAAGEERQTRTPRAAAASAGAWLRTPATTTTSTREAPPAPATARGGSAPPPSAATGRAAGRSRGPRSESVHAPCAGSRCRRAPWRGSARAGARGRTRAARGAAPSGHSQWSCSAS